MMKFFFSYFFLFFLFLFFNYYLFSFENIPNYRDFVGAEYFYNIENSWQIGTLMRYSINFLFTHHIDIVFVYKIIFSLYFTSSFLFIYGGIYKFSRLLYLKKSLMQKIFIFLLTFFSVYNTWVFERVLMGQLGVFLGYSLLFLNIALLFELFNSWSNKINNIITKEVFILSFSLFFSLFISPHYPIIILIILGIYFLHTTINSLFYHLDIQKKLYQFLFVVIPSVLFLALRYLGEVQYLSFSQSLHQSQILENFSLWEKTPYFFITSLLGGNSWMSNGFIEKINISIDLGFLNIFSLGFYPLLALPLFLFLLFIYFSVIRLYINKYSLYKNRLLLFAIFAFPIFIILNFGLSGGLELINSHVYNLPFAYIFRESGKFYALVLISLTILALAFWKVVIKEKNMKNIFSQENIIIIIFCFTCSGFFPFFYLAKNLNQPIYPQIYKDLQKDCSADEKILFLPLSQYSVHSYSPNIFMINPDQYLFPCSRLAHSFTFLGSNDIEISSDGKYRDLQKIILSLSQKSDEKSLQNKSLEKEMMKFLQIMKKEKVDFIIIDVKNKKHEVLILKNNIAKHSSMYNNDSNIFIFTVRK